MLEISLGCVLWLEPFCLSVCCVLWLVCDRIDIWFVGACHLYDWLWYDVSVILGGAFTVHCHPPAQQPRKSQTTHTHTQPFNGLCPRLSGWAGTRRNITLSHPSWLSDILYQLSLSTTIHCILLVQFTCFTEYFSTTSLQVLFGLTLGLRPSASYFIHFFIQSSSSFCNTCPYHCSLLYQCYVICF